MESRVYLLLILFGIVQCAHTLVVPGKCDQFKAMKNFEPKKYLGRWYEQARLFDIYQAGAVCNSDMLTDISEDGKMKFAVNSTGVIALTGHQYWQSGTVTLANPDDPDHGANMIYDYAARKPVYSLMKIDYDRYAIMYFCEEKPLNLRVQYMWILTRERQPGPALIDEAMHDIKAAGFLTSTFMTIRQHDCPSL